MVTISELMDFFEGIAPKTLAEDYDNVGLLVEAVTEEIETLVLALDADEQTVEDAAKLGAQLILTHHPVMFRPVNRLTEAEGGQRTLRRLLQKGIGLFAMHTNYDSAENGLGDAFLDAFGEFSEPAHDNCELLFGAVLFNGQLCLCEGNHMHIQAGCILCQNFCQG